MIIGGFDDRLDSSWLEAFCDYESCQLG